MSGDLDILSMSDEEFARLSVPADSTKADAQPAAAAAPAEATVEAEEPVENAELPESASVQENTQPEVETESKDESEDKASADGEASEKEPAPAAAPVEAKSEIEEEPQADEKQEAAEKTPSEYEAFYKQIMAPFKANGKLIQLQSVDEVIALMQMGANYTKKMQAIQTHKKYLMMLENNGLLDEQKLSFLIDLDKKNPEAIKKYLKDANIDPIDVDTSSEVNYKNGSHTITDQEVALDMAIKDVSAMAGGQETLQSVNAWDTASKKVLWDNPDLLAVIHSQRENGIYGHICTEIERRKAIGQIGPHMSFLQAYRLVGDDLAARGAFKSITQPAQPAPMHVGGRTPVAVRPAKTSTTKATDARVRAAAPTRSSSRPANIPVNVLAMSDEEFLKLEKKV